MYTGMIRVHYPLKQGTIILMTEKAVAGKSNAGTGNKPVKSKK